MAAFVHLTDQLEQQDIAAIPNETVLDVLKEIFRKEWPTCDVLLYGSMVSGFGAAGSADMDMTLVELQIEDSRQKAALEKARELVVASPHFESVDQLKGHVAVLKFRHISSGVDCDLVINNTVAVQNSQLLREYSRCDERVRPLVLAVKRWAKAKHVADPSNGTLSSYAWSLLTVHFLQRQLPPVLPVLRGDGVPCDGVSFLLADRFRSSNKQSVGALFSGFFRYYLKFDWKRHMVSTCSLELKEARRVAQFMQRMCIEDPFEVEHDLGSVISSTEAQQRIYQEILDADTKMRKALQCPCSPGCRDMQPVPELDEAVIHKCYVCDDTKHGARMCMKRSSLPLKYYQKKKVCLVWNGFAHNPKHDTRTCKSVHVCYNCMDETHAFPQCPVGDDEVLTTPVVKDTEPSMGSFVIPDRFEDLVIQWTLEIINDVRAIGVGAGEIPSSCERLPDLAQRLVPWLFEETRAGLQRDLEQFSTPPVSVRITKSQTGVIQVKKVQLDYVEQEDSDDDSADYGALPGNFLVLCEKEAGSVELLDAAQTWYTFGMVEFIDKSKNEVKIKIGPRQRFGRECTRGDSLSTGDEVLMYVASDLTSGRRVFHALSALLHAKCPKCQMEQRDGDVTCPKCKSKWKHLEIFACAANGTLSVQRRALPSTRHEKLCEEHGLNDAQKKFVLTLASNLVGVHLAHGPPGTGKSKTIVAALRLLVSMESRKVCMAAPTNVAAALVAERFLESLRANPGDIHLSEIVVVANKKRMTLTPALQAVHLYSRWRRLKQALLSVDSAMTNVFTATGVSDPTLTMDMKLAAARKALWKARNKLVFIDDVLSGELPRELSSSELEQTAREAATWCRIFLACLEKMTACEWDRVRQELRDPVPMREDSLKFACVARVAEHVASTSGEDLDLDLPNDLITLFLRLSAQRVEKVLPQLRVLTRAIDMQNIIAAIMKGARLVFSTASSLGSFAIARNYNPRTVIIDECSQLTTASAMLALATHCEHLVLIGDPKQLPPTVLSDRCLRQGYQTSLFDRIVNNGYVPQLLNIQYRMHPRISCFPKEKFYTNLKDGITEHDRRQSWHDDDFFQPFLFIDVDYSSEAKEGSSTYNTHEADFIYFLVKKFVDQHDDRDATVGVIPPYQAQLDLLEPRLKRLGEKAKHVTILTKTVDGFQGQECDVIIVSGTRSNPHGIIGFWRDERRLNVALTRAKSSLWFVGHARTLQKKSVLFAQLIQHAHDTEQFRTVSTELKKEVAKVARTTFDRSQLQDAEYLENAMWRIQLAATAKKQMQDAEQTVCAEAMEFIQKLADGRHPRRPVVPSNIGFLKGCVYEKTIGERLRMVWMIDVDRGSAKQVIKILGLVSHTQTPKLVQQLLRSQAGMSDGYLERCKNRRSNGKLRIPCTFPPDRSYEWMKPPAGSAALSPKEGQGENVSIATNLEVADAGQSLRQMKFYVLETWAANMILDQTLGDAEMKLCLTEEEEDIVNSKHSRFVLGRSGTGKTTVLTRKMFKREMAAEKMGDGTVARQLLVTAAPKLCNAIKEHYDNLRICNRSHTVLPSMRQQTTVPLLRPLDDTQMPCIVTLMQLLEMLDASLPEEHRFYGDDDSSESDDIGPMSDDDWSDSDDDNGDGNVTECVAPRVRWRGTVSRGDTMVEFERFEGVYWPRFSSERKKTFDVSLVWMEIASVIKGGREAVTKGNALTEDEYANLCSMRAAKVKLESRARALHAIYRRYERELRGRREHDMADVVLHLHRKLNDFPLPEKFDAVYIDESQDLSPAQIALFVFLSGNIDGFLFAGDTAQTIARGVGFRFADVKALFYDYFLPRLSDGKQCGANVPPVLQLTKNYRTHSGVLGLASMAVDIIGTWFPESIDTLKRETSQVHGDLPLFISGVENSFLHLFCGDVTELDFGAGQAILVRSEESKAEVEKLIQGRGLVLTIAESKGLEFNDVLIYNFFKDSPQHTWRMMYAYLASLGKTTPKHPPFNKTEHGTLEHELKRLYVAITRTKNQLWFYDECREKHTPMMDIWDAHGLLEVVTDAVSLAGRSLASKSTPEEWKAKGIAYMRDGNYARAKTCFNRSGHEKREREAHAYYAREKAGRVPDQEAKELYIEAAELFNSLPQTTRLAAECFQKAAEHARAAALFEDIKEWKLAGNCHIKAKAWTRAAKAFQHDSDITSVEKCLKSCRKAEASERGMAEYGLQVIQDRCSEVTHTHENYAALQQLLLSYAKRFARAYLMNEQKKRMNLFLQALPVETRRKFLRRNEQWELLADMENKQDNLLDAAAAYERADKFQKAFRVLQRLNHDIDALQWMVDRLWRSLPCPPWTCNPFTNISKDAKWMTKQIEDYMSQLAPDTVCTTRAEALFLLTASEGKAPAPPSPSSPRLEMAFYSLALLTFNDEVADDEVADDEVADAFAHLQSLDKCVTDLNATVSKIVRGTDPVGSEDCMRFFSVSPGLRGWTCSSDNWKARSELAMAEFQNNARKYLHQHLDTIATEVVKRCEKPLEIAYADVREDNPDSLRKLFEMSLQRLWILQRCASRNPKITWKGLKEAQNDLLRLLYPDRTRSNMDVVVEYRTSPTVIQHLEHVFITWNSQEQQSLDDTFRLLEIASITNDLPHVSSKQSNNTRENNILRGWKEAFLLESGVDRDVVLAMDRLYSMLAVMFSDHIRHQKTGRSESMELWTFLRCLEECVTIFSILHPSGAVLPREFLMDYCTSPLRAATLSAQIRTRQTWILAKKHMFHIAQMLTVILSGNISPNWAKQIKKDTKGFVERVVRLQALCFLNARNKSQRTANQMFALGQQAQNRRHTSLLQRAYDAAVFMRQAYVGEIPNHSKIAEHMVTLFDKTKVPLVSINLIMPSAATKDSDTKSPAWLLQFFKRVHLPCMREDGSFDASVLTVAARSTIAVHERITRCSVCPKPTKNVCSKCKVTYFCSPACQRADRKEHKSYCRDPDGDNDDGAADAQYEAALGKKAVADNPVVANWIRAKLQQVLAVVRNNLKDLSAHAREKLRMDRALSEAQDLSVDYRHLVMTAFEQRMEAHEAVEEAGALIDKAGKVLNENGNLLGEDIVDTLDEDHESLQDARDTVQECSKLLDARVLTQTEDPKLREHISECSEAVARLQEAQCALEGTTAAAEAKIVGEQSVKRRNAEKKATKAKKRKKKKGRKGA